LTAQATALSGDGPAGNRAPVAAAPGRRPARGYASGKDDYLSRLRKIEGQVRGLQKMVEADTWCPDVVVQVASATRALQEVAVGLLNDHLHHCVMNAVRASDVGGEESLAEVAHTIRQVIRL
jgi:CsoR family transcriptional regulator, copper-sensing transcriptional repressor